MTRRSKHHHFVPKAMQRHFSENGKNLWYAERADDAGVDFNVRWANIDSSFAIKNLYTIIGESGPSDYVEKNLYAPIDDYLGKLIRESNSYFDGGYAPDFSGGALDDLALVMWEMVKRTPDFFEKLEIGEGNGSFASVSDSGLASSASRSVRAYSSSQISRDIRNRVAIAPPSDEIISHLRKRSIVWGLVDTKHSFVLSSMMVYRIGNGGGNGLAHPNSEFWLPITPKRVLVLLENSDGRVPLVNRVGMNKIREVNEFAVRNSRSFASSSLELIKSLLCAQGFSFKVHPKG